MKSFNMMKSLVLMMVLCCSYFAASAQSSANGSDPTSPVVYPNTGNAEADAAQYEMNKKAYYENAPVAGDPTTPEMDPIQYEQTKMAKQLAAEAAQQLALEQARTSGANVITRAEFDAMPAVKQVAMKNAGFIIIEPTSK